MNGEGEKRREEAGGERREAGDGTADDYPTRRPSQRNHQASRAQPPTESPSQPSPTANGVTKPAEPNPPTESP
ncbi:hypothetical protein [Paenibacillus daejeonensis]|uniref:hypothetical protein n=1 Tax=Paenibacillus daejeonensis TaxID=135193 RepID=UPI0012F8C5D7|nr:hypothetical protein [Paenibacillus daejeonensis]